MYYCPAPHRTCVCCGQPHWARACAHAPNSPLRHGPYTHIDKSHGYWGIHRYMYLDVKDCRKWTLHNSCTIIAVSTCWLTGIKLTQQRSSYTLAQDLNHWSMYTCTWQKCLLGSTKTYKMHCPPTFYNPFDSSNVNIQLWEVVDKTWCVHGHYFSAILLGCFRKYHPFNIVWCKES